MNENTGSAHMLATAPGAPKSKVARPPSASPSPSSSSSLPDFFWVGWLIQRAVVGVSICVCVRVSVLLGRMRTEAQRGEPSTKI